jgi:3-oxoacyl-[acyl-carrier-protein] synthase III
VSELLVGALPAQEASQRRAVRGAALASVAAALPPTVVPTRAVAERLGVTEDWVVARTGVRERRRAGDGQTLAALAAQAGRRALASAGLSAGELDLVMVATFTKDHVLPDAAPLVAAELGAARAGAFDVGAACTGFLSALALATAQIEAGRARAALVVGAELLSRFTDHDDRRTAALFGDGAGAAVVGAADAPGRIGPILLRADGAGHGWIVATREEAKIRMAGHETFKHAVNRLSEVTREAADAAGVGLEEIDLFVYHQANARILRAVGERLGLASERVYECIARMGNTSSASIPLALAEAQDGGQLLPGARVLLGAFGAGFTWGGTVIEWGRDGA